MSALKAGDKAYWLYEAKGGYGYLIKVAAVVVRPTAKRVRITVARKIDGVWVQEQRTVMPEKLVPRTQICPELDELAQ